MSLTDRRLRGPCLVVAALAGCTRGGGDPPMDGDPRSCSNLVAPVADEGATHVPFGTPVTYAANPPASGSHWPSPHPWGAFNEVVPREWWVHNLEHGGVVLLFKCGDYPDGGGATDGGASTDMGRPWPCPEITTGLRQLLGERSPDKFNEVRMLISADLKMPKRVAAIAWGWVYQSDSLDLAALRCFRDARYGRGPEDAP